MSSMVKPQIRNVNDIFNEILAFNPLGISAYGYWGTPSDTAVTPCETLCFSAFSSSSFGSFSSSSFILYNSLSPKYVVFSFPLVYLLLLLF